MHAGQQQPLPAVTTDGTQKAPVNALGYAPATLATVLRIMGCITVLCSGIYSCKDTRGRHGVCRCNMHQP